MNKPLAEAGGEVGHFNQFKIEDIITPRDKPLSYSRRDFFKVSLSTGHNRFHYADNSFEVNGTALVFTNPMVPYLWDRVSEEQTGYVCIFTEPFFSRFGNIKDFPVFQFTDAAIIPLTEDQVPLFRELFVKMDKELQGDYAYKYDLLRNLLMEVVHNAQKMQPAQGHTFTGSKAAERITTLFADLLERQFPIDQNNPLLKLITPADFASRLNVHVNHLNKALKEITGKTTSRLIHDRMLQEARVLLKSTGWTINEIAWSLGFEEPNHFSAFFKRKSNITPNKYRQTQPD